MEPPLTSTCRTLLGVPVRLRSREPALLHAALSGLPACADGARAELLLRLTSTHTAPDPLLHRVDGTVLHVSGAGFTGRADHAARTGEADVSPALLTRPESLDAALLSLALWLVTRLDRQPLHAACISRGDVTLLLEGPSGSGKSTLSYAAAAAGWTVHSDDAVYVQSSPPALWTHPRPVHLRESALDYFGALNASARVLRENGLWKVPAPLTVRAAEGLASARLCLLVQTRGAPRVRDIPDEEAVAEVARRAPAGFDLFSASIRDALAAVTAARAWRVDTGDDPAATIALLTSVSPG